MSSLAGLFVHRTGEDGLPWMATMGTGSTTAAGVPVTPESALRLAVYYACVRVVAEDIGKLPFAVYRDLPNGNKGKLVDHWAYRLLHQAPNADMGTMTFRETLTAHAVGWHGGFAHITWNAAGTKALALNPIHPSRVTVKRNANKALGYVVKTNDISDGPFGSVWLPQKDVLHVHGLGPLGVAGYGVALLAAETIGLGLAQEEYAATFFANDATPSGAFVHPGSIDDDALKHLRDTYLGGHEGRGKHHKVAFLREDMKWYPISVDPKAAQLIESQHFTVEQICRWFRISPHKIQHLLRATFSNIEHQAIEHVGDCLQPWAVRWEQECNRKLFRAEPEVYAEHNFDGLLRGDVAQRTLHYRQMFSIGAYSINMILRLQNMNGIGPLGDIHFVPANMVPLERAASADAAENQAGPGSDITGASANAIDTIRAAHTPVFEDAMRRVMTKEAKAVGRAATKFAADPDGFDAWSQDFFLGQADYLIEALSPASHSLAMLAAEGMNPDDAIRRYARDYTTHAMAEARTAFAGGHTGEWCKARGNGEVTQAAEHAIQMLMEANHAG